MSQFVFVKLQPLEIRLPKESLITQPSLPFALLNNHMKHRYSTSTIHLLRGDQTSIKGHVSFEERERGKIKTIPQSLNRLSIKIMIIKAKYS